MMTIISFFQSYPIYFFIFIGLLGLIIGSFLNVIIYRLPLMLQKQKVSTFNLLTPRSHCPSCKKTIPFWHNIPIFSYLILRGKCCFCGRRISIRYPIIELFSGILSVVVAVHFGVSWQTAAMLILTWGLIAMAAIDFTHLILPDVIILPLLWFGLLLSLFGIFTSSSDAIIGAIAGYLSLWLFANIYKIIRHVEGMGHGDYKLLAMLGVWAGWRMLPLIILIAALLGMIIGISLILFKKKSFRQQFPFGPYLAIAGWMSMLWGQEIYNWYLTLT